MCDFKPGDEVVCVHPGPWTSKFPLHDLWARLCNRVPIMGATYTVSRVGLNGDMPLIDLVECPAGQIHGRQLAWKAACFRKAQRLDLAAWLETSVPNTDKLDKSRRAKKREPAR